VDNDVLYREGLTVSKQVNLKLIIFNFINFKGLKVHKCEKFLGSDFEFSTIL
jgi:hypothetical protein